MTLVQSLQPSITRLVMDGNFADEPDLPPFAKTLVFDLPLILCHALDSHREVF